MIADWAYRITPETLATTAHKDRWELLIDGDGVEDLIDEFGEILEVGRTTHDGETTFFELLTCPFAGRAHSNQRGGKGKTTIMLSPTRIAFKCFSDDCADHRFSDLLRLLKRETGREPSMPIWHRPDILDHAHLWGGIDDLSNEAYERNAELDADKKIEEHYRTMESERRADPYTQYMARIHELADSQDFNLNAAEPTLQNYDVHWRDLYTSFITWQHAERAKYVEGTREHDAVWDYTNAIWWSPSEMAAQLGSSELFVLVHERKAREHWDPEYFGRDWSDADEWFDATDMKEWPHLTWDDGPGVVPNMASFFDHDLAA